MHPLPYISFAKFLRPDKRRAARVAVAQRVQAVQTFSISASDSDLWDRLRAELPEWSHSRVVPPVTIDRLERISMDLDLEESRDQAQREKAREDLRSVLMGLYRVLISSDPPTRHWREFREALRKDPSSRK